MATARQEITRIAYGEGLAKMPPDEPVFILRAQDIHAADLVEKWALWNNQTTPDKATEAHAIAAAMRAWPFHKQPD